MAPSGRPCPAACNPRLVSRIATGQTRFEAPSASWPPNPPCPPRRSRASASSSSTGRALQHLPGGTDSNFRAWGEDTIYVDRGKGAMVWDMDGNEFIDLRMGYGPVILGHGDARVDDYVNERMRLGVSFSLTSEDEIRTDGAHRGAHRLGRHGAHDRVRHRGHDARDASGACLHGSRQDREVRGPVPRRPRLRADQRRAQRHERARDRGQPGRARLGPRDPVVGRPDDHPGALQQHRVPAPPVRAAGRRDRGR